MKAHVLAYKKHLMREALAAAAETLAKMHAAK
jgi:hypothetical protein